MKEESEKAGLKLNIQKTKIKASGPNTSWQIEGENVAAVTDFTFLGFKIAFFSMREIWVWSLGWEDPLEKGKGTHSSILA